MMITMFGWTAAAPAWGAIAGDDSSHATLNGVPGDDHGREEDRDPRTMAGPLVIGSHPHRRTPFLSSAG